MPEIVLGNTDKRDVDIAYGSKDISDIFPSDQPYSGAWIQVTPLSLPQQFWTGRKHIPFLRTPAVNQEIREHFINEWREKKDPFTQVDLLDSEEDQVQELIF